VINTSGKPTIASAPARVVDEVTLGLTRTDAHLLQGLLDYVKDVDLNPRERAVLAYIDFQVAKADVEATA